MSLFFFAFFLVQNIYLNFKIIDSNTVRVFQDRREAWLELGQMDSYSAKQEFVALLHDRCPLFRPYVCAHKASQQLQNTKVCCVEPFCRLT